MTGRSVSLGHFHLTPQFDQRLAQVLYFQSPDATDQWRIDVLRASYCQYVLTESVKPPVTEDLTRLLGHPLFARGRFALYEIPQSILAGAPAY
jgi:hypothetical protein